MNGKSIGFLEVGYLEETPGNDEGTFLSEERNLINEIAERVGRIVERKQAQDELRESRLFADNLLDAQLDTVFVFDPVAQKPLKWNRAFKEVSGYSDEEISFMKAPLDFYGEEDLKRLAYSTEAVINTGKVRVEASLITKDLRFVPFEYLATCVQNREGNPEHIISVGRDITDRKRMEDALRQTEDLFSKAFSQNPDAITISRVDDGIFVSVNEGFMRSLGYTEEEVIGKTSMDLDIWDNPEDRNRAWAALNSEGKIENFEAPFRTKNGDIRYGLMSGSVLVLNGVAHILNVTKDITELRQAQGAHKLLFKAIEHTSEGVIITDPTGIIQYVNPAQESLSGYSSDELLGQTANILTSDKHDDKFYSGLWDTVNSGNVWSGRFINRKKDGNEYHEDATISPVYDDSGNLTHFVAVKHDVTSQIKLQEQLLQARQMESIGMLADRFVHEFNDKLQIINGYVSLTLSRQGLPEIVRSNMRAIKQAANSGADLIKKMSVYGLKKTVKLLPLDLNELIEQTRSALIQALPSLMEIQLFLDRDLWIIKGSQSQIQQILMNLVKNAMDAMPDGGGIIIKTRNITLDEKSCRYHPATKPGRYALIELSDTGKGMDSELLKHIFDSLFTTKEPDNGAGLGLAVVRGLVEQHGGRIVCLSDPSVGTTFRLYFPAMEEVPEEQYFEKKELPKGAPIPYFWWTMSPTSSKSFRAC